MASDSDGDFVTFGTPLEPLEEDEPLRKPIPLHEQTVKDEKGRYLRFHGAFTGGFSAGYFNTVGTKEGCSMTGKQKKKHKRHKHKGKQKKSSRKEESSGSSSEGNGQEDRGGVSTEELLRRLKSIRGKNQQ